MGGPHVENHALADKIVGFSVVAVRSRGGAGDIVRGLDFFGGITHAGAAGISAQRGWIRKGFVKFLQASTAVALAELP